MLDRLLSRAAQEDLLHQVHPAMHGGVLASLPGSSPSLIAALLFRSHPRQTLVVAPKLDDAESVAQDLGTLLPGHRVLLFPEFEILPYDVRSPYKGITGQQVEVLYHLLSGEPCVVVTSAKGLKWKVQPPEEILDYTLRFRTGQDVDYEDVLVRLGEMGYYAVPRVESPGDFARKGGILDVFSVSYENPLRIELFGDSIESMRFFDATTQRSTEETESALVPPCSPLILSADNVERAVAALRECRHGGAAERTRLEDHIRERLHFDGMERYAPFYSPRVLLTDFFMDEHRLLWFQPDEIVQQLRRLEDEVVKLHRDSTASGQPVPEPHEVYASNHDLATLAENEETLHLAHVHLLGSPAVRLRAPEDATGEDAAEAAPTGGATPTAASAVSALRLRFQSPGGFGRDLAQRLELGQRVHIFCDNEGQADRLRELLDEIADRIDFPVGDLQAGFVLADHGVAVLTDREIFQRYKQRARRRKYRISHGGSAYEELTPGDFVVHVNYGIARYLGIQKIQVEQSEIDCLQLAFAGGDKIYVTVDQLNIVEKYVGKEGLEPALTKLGTQAWERTKERAKRAIAEMAQELLKMAAVRKSRRGHACAADGHLLKELEASFIYDVQDTKADMEMAIPMDRLVCGDVGYGKTEVAVRAAFKAVLDNKQVAVLVPTTILAQQHVTTFRERLADFPVNIEMVSRLRSARDQKESLSRAERGEVDILIGTHRLLSRDVQFKSLGLVVVDEEHRFGVAHKERLKAFKETVDVLSMTATPIPRTLHMALIGLREMSLINTAPRDRLPIQTEILPFDEEIIVDAMMRELDRGGQVYFVHNRVQSIDAMAGYVRRILPSARVAVAHGQMQERQLERVMLEFMDRKHDVLVSTMIIESGLDIPSVNTLIVNRADRLGLAQLYQLRGRVGRSSHKAYAYFLVPRSGRTTDLARKRLAALQEFEALGSGLRIAMRDMEIRGAGNILGPQQHGQLAAVGFDLYCRLLEQTAAELQGREVPEEISTRVEVDLDYRIPNAYIPDPEEKMRVYKRVAACTTPTELQALRDELADRFGRPPEPAANLLRVAELRLKGHQAGVDRLRVRGGRCEVTLQQTRVPRRAEIEALLLEVPNKLEFDAAGTFRILQHLRPESRLEQVDRLLEQLLASAGAVGTA
jgi:transcription-repair coupling factor (superfamily II helicase)